MQSTPLVRHILRDEAVTRGLGDVEARMIVEWLADRAENVGATAVCETTAWTRVRGLCRTARVVATFCRLWAVPATRGAAAQLAAAERRHWPLPRGDIDAGELMETTLAWLDRHDLMPAATGRQAA